MWLCGSVVLPLCYRLLATGSCVVRKHTPCRGEGLWAWRGLVALGYRFLAPPKFCFTPEPVCSLYQKKATIIGPLFRPLIPCGLTMLPWLL